MKAEGNPATILARYREGPALLERALADVTPVELDTPPRAGGWTIRQIVHHLADGDDLWKVGLKAALGDEDGEFTLAWYWSLPQEEWAERWAYAQRSVAESLALLKACRDHVVQVLEAVPGAWDRTIGVRRPDGELEPLAVGAIVAMQTEHVEHHVRRILEIRRGLKGS